MKELINFSKGFLLTFVPFDDELSGRRLAEADENHDDVLKELQQQIQQQTNDPPAPRLNEKEPR